MSKPRGCVERVLSKLDRVQRSGDGWIARCPAHDDDTPSLSIAEGEDGRVLLHCHGGCEPEAVCAAIGSETRDLFPTDSSPDRQHGSSTSARKKNQKKTHLTLADAVAAATWYVRNNQGAGWSLTHNHGYTDQFGEKELLRVLRFEPEQHDDKTFMPIHPVDGGWQIGSPPGLLPLYRLPGLSSAELVGVCEGETATDVACGLGLSATTSPHGADAATRADWSPLSGRPRVVVLRDNNDAGVRFARDVEGLLRALPEAPEVQVMLLPDLPEGGDIADFADQRRDQGRTDDEIREEIEALIAEDRRVGGFDRAHLIQRAKWFIDDLNASKPLAAAWNNLEQYVSPLCFEEEDGAGLVMENLGDVEPQAVEWLWQGRIPLGKLSLVSGDPGLGKSTVTLDMAARITSGLPWPDDATTGPEQGDVVLLSAEDDPGDTVRPRVDAAGGTPSRIHVLKAVAEKDPKTGKPTERMFSLARDIPRLEQILKRNPSIRLVVIDPLSAYLGGGTDSHRDADVRALLAPLAGLAARHRVAILGVAHLNKAEKEKAIHRTQGSMAFVAAVRAAWLIAEDPKEKTRRLFLPIKNNLAPDLGGLAYTVESAPVPGGGTVGRIQWEEGTVDASVDQALAGGGGRRSKKADAASWLRGFLADGPKESENIYREAEKAGHSRRTIQRAKDEINVISRPGGFGKRWLWQLPGWGPPPEPPAEDGDSDSDAGDPSQEKETAEGNPQCSPSGDEVGEHCDQQNSPQSAPSDPGLQFLANTERVGEHWEDEHTEFANSSSVRQVSGCGSELAHTGAECSEQSSPNVGVR